MSYNKNKREALRKNKQKMINSLHDEIEKEIVDSSDEGDYDVEMDEINHGLDPDNSSLPSINPRDYKYPFENIIMEGGGNKGLAYVGAIKCLEELNIMSQIKRIAGASAGAIGGALLAVGYSSDELLGYLSSDLESIFLDHSCGCLSLIPNIIRTFGWNPGNRSYRWFGEIIKKKTGNPDTTFYEIYKSRGIELCIAVTNLSLRTTEYCHVKTTPDMAIRDALKMTMAIPVVFSAVQYENHGQTDVYVDGGVLTNYPINCFDGWYLSMEREDSFLSRMRPLKDLPALMSPRNRFKQTGPNKSIGFLLYDETETEFLRYKLEKRIGKVLPERPKEDTKLFLEYEEKKKVRRKAEKEHSKAVLAVEEFLLVLKKQNVTNQQYIEKKELKKALEDENFSAKNKELLFGKDYTLEKTFQLLNDNGSDKIDFKELVQFIEERGIRMQLRFQGFGRKNVVSLNTYLDALQDTLLTNLKYVSVKEEDEERTVGINTGYIGTMNYTLEQSDRDFIAERGYNATLSFLRYYASKNPSTVIKQATAGVHVKQPESINKQ